MEEISIKIKIAEREYPMRVHPSDEEGVRRAARQVNEQLKELREHFGLEDKQDLLAMVAFNCLVQQSRTEEAKAALEREVSAQLLALDQAAAAHLPE